MNISKGNKIGLIVGLITFITPYPYYAISRISGSLPSENDWWSQGGNHGPWRWDWQMYLVLPPIYILIFGAFLLILIGFVLGIKNKSPIQFGTYFCLGMIYVGLFYVQIQTVFWTID